jgi:predicted metal-dependent phosphoesterase TrpH
VIDLHLHTTASDGALSPEALVRACAAAGITTMAVTDHDTVGGLREATTAADAAGVRLLPGIEITALHNGRDVHVLGYGFDPDDSLLATFLTAQRQDRRRRVVAMAEKLAALGVPVDLTHLHDPRGETSQRALGRPALGAALVDAGHARDLADAFDRYLGSGRPAFVERIGPPPRDVFSLIRRAGGVASIAHPVKIGDDGLVRQFVEDGLDAIEVYHPDHDAEATSRYRAMADEAGLLVTGGSDYHGDNTTRAPAFGRIGLPAADFDRLIASASGAPRRG